MIQLSQGLVAGFLSQFTLFASIILGFFVYIIYMAASNFMITQRRLESRIHTKFEYIQQINNNVANNKTNLEFLASHDDMTLLQVELDELKNMIEQKLGQTSARRAAPINNLTYIIDSKGHLSGSEIRFQTNQGVSVL